MPQAASRANGRRSKVRFRVEPVFAPQQGRMGRIIRTIGLARARAAITLANMACNMRRLSWLTERRQRG